MKKKICLTVELTERIDCLGLYTVEYNASGTPLFIHFYSTLRRCTLSLNGQNWHNGTNLNLKWSESTSLSGNKNIIRNDQFSHRIHTFSLDQVCYAQHLLLKKSWSSKILNYTHQVGMKTNYATEHPQIKFELNEDLGRERS